MKIDFDPATGYIDVKRTIPGTPAERAGIAPPDKIVTVDGKLYRGRTLRDAVADIRGKAGETVTLSILRGDKLVSVPVVREKVVFDKVSQMMLDGRRRLRRASRASTRRLRRRSTTRSPELASQGGARRWWSICVDNPGGSFDDAVAVGRRARPRRVDGRDAEEARARSSPSCRRRRPCFADGAIAVLVDHDTASSAELVAAALQELRHATIVGSRTKGKWSVQKLEDLPNGYAVKYTMALFTSPSGKTYEGTGLTPDVEVDQAEDAVERALMVTDPAKRLADDTQLHTAVAVLAHAR